MALPEQQERRSWLYRFLLQTQLRQGIIYRPLLLAALSVFSVLVLSSPVSAQELNCDDFPNQAAAQQELREDSSDPEGLDGPPGAASTGIPGVACEDLPPPTDFNPVDPGPGQDPIDNPFDPGPGKELLEAGGDLPIPDKSTVVTVPPPDGGRSQGQEPAALILLISSLLVFLIYRLLATK